MIPNLFKGFLLILLFLYHPHLDYYLSSLLYPKVFFTYKINYLYNFFLDQNYLLYQLKYGENLMLFKIFCTL